MWIVMLVAVPFFAYGFAHTDVLVKVGPGGFGGLGVGELVVTVIVVLLFMTRPPGPR